MKVRRFWWDIIILLLGMILGGSIVHATEGIMSGPNPIPMPYQTTPLMPVVICPPPGHFKEWYIQNYHHGAADAEDWAGEKGEDINRVLERFTNAMARYLDEIVTCKEHH
jgi:hypothetical protein